MTVEITDNALKRIKTLLEAADSDTAYFRLAVNGGGCQGFEYQMSVETIPNVDDEVIIRNDCTVRIDPTSLPFLLGTRLDWIETLAEEKFEFTNPNATSACGCGVSFSI